MEKRGLFLPYYMLHDVSPLRQRLCEYDKRDKTNVSSQTKQWHVFSLWLSLTKPPPFPDSLRHPSLHSNEANPSIHFFVT